jgi:radical SAM-linked protein
MPGAVSVKPAILEKILPFVSRPSRYLSGEWNAVAKDPASVSVTVGLAFPDAYEIGMSHLGLKLLCQVVNARPDLLAEPVYAPWADAEARHRTQAIPLATHVSGLPLGALDILGFTLQHELSYTTLLTMLELAGIPLRAEARDERHPLVVAGGPGAFAPEPLADFIDAFLIGDGEEAVLELCDAVRDAKQAGSRRADMLAAVKRVPGMYVPSLHRPGEVARKRTVPLGGVSYGAFPVPYADVVHDRVTLEVMRGCARGCRFCQAGYIYRPVRELSAGAVAQAVDEALRGSGYEEVSLSALSVSDLACLPEVLPRLMGRLAGERVALSVPSLRVEALNRSEALAAEIARVRRTGFTIAPEAGSARLRAVINKTGFDEAEILAAVRTAARAGWGSVKLYFMIGLPTETEADLDELVRVARECARAARREAPRGFGLTVSASSFTPKPHTPFQWCPQEPMELLRQKQAFLRARLREARIAFKWHQAESSFLEAVLGLGGREVGRAIAAAQARGARFDGWTEQLDFPRWLEAFAVAGVDPGAIANRPRALDGPLPWDHIDSGVSRSFLEREHARALAGQATEDCHTGPCNGCGQICAPDWRRWADGADRDPRPAAPEPAEAGEAADADAAPVQRMHFEFQKVGELKFLSHLELMRALQRALRRARLPVAYTQGFNPQPRLSLAQALAVGVEALREPGELLLRRRMEPEAVVAAWNRHLSPDLRILRAWEAALHGPALSAGVRAAAYRIWLPPNGWDPLLLADLGSERACADFLAQGPIPVEVAKKGRPHTLDARPYIRRFAPVGGDLPAWEMDLRAGLLGSVKPQVVMRGFLGGRVPPGDLDRLLSSLRITRTAVLLEG